MSNNGVWGGGGEQGDCAVVCAWLETFWFDLFLLSLLFLLLFLPSPLFSSHPPCSPTLFYFGPRPELADRGEFYEIKLPNVDWRDALGTSSRDVGGHGR